MILPSLPRWVVGLGLPVVAALGLVVAGVAIDWRGYNRGHAAAMAKTAAAQAALELRVADRDRELAATVLKLRDASAVRAQLSERLRHEAINAPGADRVALPIGSVRRVRSSWQD